MYSVNIGAVLFMEARVVYVKDKLLCVVVDLN